MNKSREGTRGFGGFGNHSQANLNKIQWVIQETCTFPKKIKMMLGRMKGTFGIRGLVIKGFKHSFSHRTFGCI